MGTLIHNNPRNQGALMPNKHTPEQFGVIIYISALFGKWCPYDGQEWLLEY